MPKNVVVSGNRSSTPGRTGANLVVLPYQPQPFQSYRFRMATSTFPYEDSCAYDLFKLSSQGTIGMVYNKSSLLTFKKSTDYIVDVRNVSYPSFVFNILGILENHPHWNPDRFYLFRLPKLLSVLLPVV